jgi:C1A family cysteine protease
MCTPIKNQGACSACYAFTAVETVESAIAIYYNQTPVALSTQQVVSCSQISGNSGCKGGWTIWSWDYMQTNPLETGENYPYNYLSYDNGETPGC